MPEDPPKQIQRINQILGLYGTPDNTTLEQIPQETTYLEGYKPLSWEERMYWEQWEGKGAGEKFRTGIKADWEKTKGGLRYLGSDVMGYLFGQNEETKQMREKAEENFAAAPEGRGFFYEVGSFVPQTVGTLTALGLAPFTGGTSLAAIPAMVGTANITALGARIVGQTLHEYDEYTAEKGIEPNDLTRWGVALGAGAAEFAAEKIRLGRLLPDGLAGKMMAQTLKANPDMADDLMRKWARNDPKMFDKFKKLSGTIAKNMNEEGMEEAATEFVQSYLNNIYLNPEDRSKLQDVVVNAAHAYRGGAMMGGLLGPASYTSNQMYHRMRRAKNGVTLVETSEGSVYEYLGQDAEDPNMVSVMDNKLNMRSIHKDQIKDHRSMTGDELKDYLNVYRDTQANLPEMEEQLRRNTARQHVDNIGRGLLYRGAETPSIKMGQTREGAYVFIRDERNDGIGSQYIVVDPETLQPAIIASKEITETFTLDYDNWAENELEHLLSEQDSQRAEQMAGELVEQAAKEESGLDDLKPGEKINYQEREWLIREVGSDGALAVEEITEDESLGESMTIPAEEIPNVLTYQGAIAQEEGTEETEQQQDVKVLNDGKTDYQVTNNQVAQKFTTAKAAEGVVKKLSEEYPKLTFTVEEFDNGDPFAKNEYTINVQVGQGAATEQTVPEIAEGTRLQATGENGPKKAWYDGVEEVDGKRTHLVRWSNTPGVKYESTNRVDYYTDEEFTDSFTPMQDEVASVDDTTPKYFNNGQEVTKGYIKGRIRAAKNPNDLNGLMWENDTELDNLSKEKFPEAVPQYLFEGKEIERDEAMGLIDGATEAADLGQLEIRNDDELGATYLERFNQLQPQEAGETPGTPQPATTGATEDTPEVVQEEPEITPEIDQSQEEALAEIEEFQPEPVAEEEVEMEEVELPEEKLNQPISSEATTNSLTAAAELFTDIGKRMTLLSKPFSDLDIKTKRMMQERMITAVHNSKIRDIIVRLVPINVMDNLIGEKGSSDKFLNDPSMFVESISPSGGIPISVNQFFDSLANSITSDGTSNILTSSGLFKLGPGEGEILPANGADQVNSIGKNSPVAVNRAEIIEVPDMGGRPDNILPTSEATNNNLITEPNGSTRSGATITPGANLSGDEINRIPTDNTVSSSHKAKIENNLKSTKEKDDKNINTHPPMPTERGPQWNDWVSRYSENSEEVYQAWEDEQKSAPFSQLTDSEQELLGKRVTRESFERFGDKNKVTMTIARSWFVPKGTRMYNQHGIDVIAQEISEQYGVEMTPQNVVEFILRNPAGRVRKTTDLQNELAKKYREMTGRGPKNRNLPKNTKIDLGDWLLATEPGWFGDPLDVLEKNKEKLSKENYERFKQQIIEENEQGEEFSRAIGAIPGGETGEDQEVRGPSGQGESTDQAAGVREETTGIQGGSAQADTGEPVRNERVAQSDLYNQAAQIILEGNNELPRISELVYKSNDIEGLRELLNLPFVRRNQQLEKDINLRINYLERHPEKQEKSEPAQKIEDFGEKIGGARKDVWSERLKEVNNLTDEDLLNRPFGETLPIPDYKAMVESGQLTIEEAAFLHYLRTNMKRKPSSRSGQYEKQRWLRAANGYKDYYTWMLEDREGFKERHGKDLMGMLSGSLSEHALNEINEHTKLLKALGFPATFDGNLGKFKIKQFEGRMISKGKDVTGKTTFTIVSDRRIIEDFETWEEAAAGLKILLQDKTGRSDKVSFGMWSYRDKKGVYVGKKVGAGKYIELAGPFDNANIGGQYIRDNQQQLEEKLSQQKEIPPERPDVAEERTGKDYRKGKTVTPEMFQEAFGFRGVEFGNWVENQKRQEDLNRAYDALMDLAEVVGIPPRAISLGGELGLAFGARGTGGKHAGSAHYEPDKVAINLTKVSGAGSLAHEWWHAVDNYFSRMREKKTEFMTERPRALLVKGEKDGKETWVDDTSVRKEVIGAFSDVAKAIKESGMVERSSELDKRRTKDYWSQMREMSARSFESYVREKLGQQGIKNDYLVSFKDMVDYIVQSGGSEDAYPYPTKEESPTIYRAFENFWEEIETRKEGDRTIMFRAEEIFYSNTQKALDNIQQGKATGEQWMAMLRKNRAKEAEMEWMDLEGFLGDRQGITKEEIQEYIERNKIVVEEVTKAPKPEYQDKINQLRRDRANAWDEMIEKEQDLLNRMDKAGADKDWTRQSVNKMMSMSGDEKPVLFIRRYLPDYDANEFFDAVSKYNNLDQQLEELADSEEVIGDGDTKYSQYQLPGGNNYREVLLVMPVSKREDKPRYYSAQIGNTGRYIVIDGNTHQQADPREFTDQEQAQYAAKTKNLKANRDVFQSPHWDEPNILAHVRFNERTDAEGNNILFLEELQSDWQASGRRKGFRISEKDQKRFDEITVRIREILKENDVDESDLDAVSKLRETNEEFKKLSAEGRRINPSDSSRFGEVPQMPFKKTDEWAGLALRRMVRYAIDNGFDRVAWTTGEAQAERYDLSKQIDSIEYSKIGEEYNVTIRQNNRLLDSRTLDENGLEDFVGKEMAQKIVNGEATKEYSTGLKELSGLDLKVGGAGMEGFYDKILPSIANKIGKKYGAKVETVIHGKFSPNSKPLNEYEVTKVGGQWELTGPDGAIYGVFQNAEDAFRVAEHGVNAQFVHKGHGTKAHSLPITPALFEAFKDQVPLYRRPAPQKTEFATERLSESYRLKRQDTLVRGVAEQMSERLNTPIEVVVSREELPNDLQRVINRKYADKRIPGLLDTDSGKIYLISNEADTRDPQGDAMKTILHEIVSHKGLRELLGENFDKVTMEVYESMSPGDISTFSRVYETDDPFEIADEYIAHISESGQDQSTLDRVIAWIRRQMRKLFKVDYNKNDIRDMLRRSREKLEQKRPQTAGEYLQAFHGSGKDFKRFDTGKMGSGMGENYRGWGLYFTDNKDVGKAYAEATAKYDNYLSKAAESAGERSAKWIDRALFYSGYDHNAVVPFLQEKMEYFRDNPRLANRMRRAIEHVEKNPLPQNRYVYEVMLGKAKGNLQFVAWGEPLISAQSTMINEQLQQEGVKSAALEMMLWDVTPASRIYQKLSQVLGSDKAASQLLDRAGIDGIRYAVGEVTDKEKGKSGNNYVLFNDGSAKVTGKARFRIAGGEIEKGAPINILQSRGEKSREFIQDRTISVRKWQNTIIGKGGKMTDFSNPYRQENLSHGIVKATIEDYDNRFVDPMNKVIAGIQKSAKMSYQEVNEYLLAKHAPERNLKMEERTGREVNSGMTTEEAYRIRDKYEARMTQKQIDDLWKAVGKATRYSLERAKSDGFIKPELFDELTGPDGYRYYVPMRGWSQTEADNLFEYMEADVGKSVNPYKAAKGRTSLSDNPVQYIVNMAHTSIVMGEKNKVKQHAAALVRNNLGMKDEAGNPMHGFKKVYYVWDGTMDEDGKKNYSEVVEKPAQELFDQGMVETKFNASHMKRRSMAHAKEHEVEVWIGGEKYIMILPADVANAINKTPGAWDNAGYALQQFPGKYTRWLSANFTAKNPAFIPINQIRDLQYAFWAHAIKGERGDYRRFVANLGGCRGAIIRQLKGKANYGNKYDRMYRDFMLNGGETGYIHLRDVDQLARDIQKDLRRMNSPNAFRDVYLKAGELLEHWAIRSENLSRFATYAVAIENGKSPKQAAQEAKDITVNFNRKGRISGVTGSLYAFFNAGIQGGHNAMKIAKDNPFLFAGATAGMTAMGFLAAMLNHMWAGDDDDDTVNDYEELNDYHKFNNLTIPIPGKDKFVTIPLPHFFRFFNAAGVLAYQVAIQGDKSIGLAAKEGMSSLASSLSPVNPVEFLTDEGGLTLRPVAPTVLMPVIDIMTNSDFTGSPIRREPFTSTLEGRVANSQLGQRNVNRFVKYLTDGWFKLGGGDPQSGSKFYMDKEGNLKRVSDIMDVNPSNVEHVFEYFLGGRGKFWNNVLKTSEGVITGAAEVVQGDKEFSQMLSDVDANNVPVFRRLISRPWQNSVNTRYYDIINELEDYKSFIRAKAKMDPNIEVEDLLDPYHDYVNEELKYLRQDLGYIDEDIEYLEGSGSTENVDELKNQKELLVRTFIEQVAKYPR